MQRYVSAKEKTDFFFRNSQKTSFVFKNLFFVYHEFCSKFIKNIEKVDFLVKQNLYLSLRTSLLTKLREKQAKIHL